MIISLTTHYPQQAVVQYYHSHQSPLIIGIDSTEATLNEQTISTLKTVKPYGVILLSKNSRTTQQTKSLISSIHEYGKSIGIKIKVAVDEEGGEVSRFKHLKGYPNEFTGIKNFSTESQNKHSQFLKSLGVDINFAPVADIGYETKSIVYRRSAGENSEDTSNIITQIIQLQKENGVESTLKHFPGHGRTIKDSHVEQATIKMSFENWLNSEAVPFRNGITAGAENIMTGHLTFPLIDTENATVSPKWLISILRDQLRFKGRIITDDLKMAGLDSTVKSQDTKNGKITIKCSNSGRTEEVHIKNPMHHHSIKIKLALDAGATNPLIILNEKDLVEVFNKWIEIERACL